MTTTNRSLPPLSDSDVTELRKVVVEYWNAIATCDELGGVLGDLVRETEVKVTEFLATGDPWDVYQASRITAEFEVLRRLRS